MERESYLSAKPASIQKQPHWAPAAGCKRKWQLGLSVLAKTGTKMIVIIDNYDSFTYNLVQRLGEIDSAIEVTVFRNDKTTIAEIEALSPSHVIISPGPCTPDDAGISLDCAGHFHGRLPLLGVCLGHQSIGQATGGKIVRAEKLMHGKTDQIHHDGKVIYKGIASPMIATRYHSLVIQPDTLSSEFAINAWTEPKNQNGEREIMGIQHKEHSTFGVQFHPESFLTTEGSTMLKNFIAIK